MRWSGSGFPRPTIPVAGHRPQVTSCDCVRGNERGGNLGASSKGLPFCVRLPPLRSSLARCQGPDPADGVLMHRAGLCWAAMRQHRRLSAPPGGGKNAQLSARRAGRWDPTCAGPSRPRRDRCIRSPHDASRGDADRGGSLREGRGCRLPDVAPTSTAARQIPEEAPQAEPRGARTTSMSTSFRKLLRGMPRSTIGAAKEVSPCRNGRSRRSMRGATLPGTGAPSGSDPVAPRNRI